MATTTCTGAYEIPEGFEAGGGSVAPGNGCGRSIKIPDTPWDVKTDAKGKTVSQHRQVTCPACGVDTFVVKEA